MASYSTIPKDEAEPLVAAAPKAASPKFKVTAAALCIACAVAGTATRAARETRAGPLATIGDETPTDPPAPRAPLRLRTDSSLLPSACRGVERVGGRARLGSRGP